MIDIGTPVAVLVGKESIGSVNNKSVQNFNEADRSLTREKAIELVIDLAKPEDAVIATTGKAGRELFELRNSRNQPNDDFLTVGGMGHASTIALGVAQFQRQRCVICLDGDGAVLMHMGSLATIGAQKPQNLVHVLLNNGSHDSVGGQPTVAAKIDFEALSLACGYNHYFAAWEETELKKAWTDIVNTDGPIFLEIFISQGARSTLGRPTLTPKENKANFVKKLLRNKD